MMCVGQVCELVMLMSTMTCCKFDKQLPAIEPAQQMCSSDRTALASHSAQAKGWHACCQGNVRPHSLEAQRTASCAAS